MHASAAAAAAAEYAAGQSCQVAAPSTHAQGSAFDQSVVSGASCIVSQDGCHVGVRTHCDVPPDRGPARSGITLWAGGGSGCHIHMRIPLVACLQIMPPLFAVKAGTGCLGGVSLCFTCWCLQEIMPRTGMC